MKAHDLTWRDIREIVTIADSIFDESGWKFDSEQAYYEEVLKRFNQAGRNEK